MNHGRFKYEKLSKYPHLGPKDAAIWEKFMAMYPDEYKNVDYDCWVGEGAFPEEESKSDIFKDNFKDLTKKRIDVCGTKEYGKVDCIEIRPHAGSSALGSVLCNFYLHKDDLGEHLHGKIIITDRAQADMARLCEADNIKLIEVGEI